jgi:nucleotide-binding universal stress UspA family protein
VHAWEYGYINAPDLEGSFPVVGADLKEVRDAAERALEKTLREAHAETDSVEIERRVVEGRPARVLVDESRDAELLVVGSRGHGGFAGLLLGSVSQQVAHHASCPVVIVHPSRKS